MEDTEKLAKLKTAIAPDTAVDEVLEDTLKAAETLILNRMYPFGYVDGTQVPPRYEWLQIQLAVELFNRRGAEGQSSHNENGTTRTWAESSRLLKRIVPHCGSVFIPSAGEGTS